MNNWEQGYSDSQFRADLVQYFEQAIEQFSELEEIVDETVPTGEEKNRIEDSLHEVYRTLLHIKQQL